MGAMRVGEEVRLINTENLLVDDNFRPGPGWLWQSGKCIKINLMIRGGCTGSKTSLQGQSLGGSP